MQFLWLDLAHKTPTVLLIFDVMTSDRDLNGFPNMPFVHEITYVSSCNKCLAFNDLFKNYTRGCYENY